MQVQFLTSAGNFAHAPVHACAIAASQWEDWPSQIPYRILPSWRIKSYEQPILQPVATLQRYYHLYFFKTSYWTKFWEQYEINIDLTKYFKTKIDFLHFEIKPKEWYHGNDHSSIFLKLKGQPGKYFGYY